MTEEIKEVLTQIGYTLHDSGKEYRARPIYRDSDNETVLCINKTTGQWIDFKEQISGSFEDLIKISLNLKTKEEAKTWISDRYGLTISRKQERPLIKGQRIFPKEFLSKLIQNDAYWIKRGVSSETLRTFGGGVAESGKMANRYVFPIFNSKGEVIGLSGRDLLNAKESKRPKWKHLGDKCEWKYPLKVNYEIIKQKNEVVLVESIGDMLSLWDAGVKNMIVTFGLDISIPTLNLLIKLDPDKIRLSFNNDSGNNFAGNIAATKAHKKLSKYFSPSQIEIRLPSKKDFGEMTKEEILAWNK